jgi:DNA-binding NarL/FixJ family response regulator
MEAIKRLLQIDPSARAIVSSGYSNDPIMAGYQDHGFTGVVPKPYRLKQLGEAVARALAKRGRGGESKISGANA